MTWLLPHQSMSSLHDLFIDKDEFYKYCGLCGLLTFPYPCALGTKLAHTPISWPAPMLSFSFVGASWLPPHQAIQAETSRCWLKVSLSSASNKKAECSDNHTQVSQPAGDLNIHWKQMVGVGSWGGTGHKAYSRSIYKLPVTPYPMWFPEGLCRKVDSVIKTQFSSGSSVDQIVIALSN